jgi:hypothetical protein
MYLTSLRKNRAYRKKFFRSKKKGITIIYLIGLRAKRQNSSGSSYEDPSLDEKTLRNRFFFCHPLFLRGWIFLSLARRTGETDPPGQC